MSTWQWSEIGQIALAGLGVAINAWQARSSLLVWWRVRGAGNGRVAVARSTARADTVFLAVQLGLGWIAAVSWLAQTHGLLVSAFPGLWTAPSVRMGLTVLVAAAGMANWVDRRIIDAETDRYLGRGSS